MKKIIKWLDLQKEGILIGAGVAVAIYYFNWTVPLINIQETGTHKLFILLAICTIAGALIDSVYKPNK